MDSSNRIDSIQFFENLRVLTQIDVCKQLNSCSLVLASMLSEKWEQIVKMREMTTDSTWEIAISRDVLMIYLQFKDKTQDFQIGFKEDPDSKEDFYIEQDPCWNSCIFHYKTAHQLEESSFKALQLLSNLFPPLRFHRITVPLGPRCPDFPFRFLSKLPRSFAKHVDLQADQEVDCGDLTTFLEAVKYPTKGRSRLDLGYRLDIRVKIKNMVACDEILLRGDDLSIADARFLTHDSIQKLDVKCAEIGENNFTSKDFNAFFRSWMTKEKTFRADKITFDIREDQKIKMEEVMEGLNAHVGKPRIRDRWRVDYEMFREVLDAKAIDCDQGWDISDDRGYLATVLLEPSRLSFIAFTWPFPLRSYETFVQLAISWAREHINRNGSRQEKLKRKIARRGVSPRAKDVEKLKRLAEKMERCNKSLENCLEEQEKCKFWSID